MKKQILIVAIITLLVAMVASAGCTINFPPPPPNYHDPSVLTGKWTGMAAGGFKVTGALFDNNTSRRIPRIPGKVITLYASNGNDPADTSQYVEIKNITTDKQGNYAFTVRPSEDRYRYYATVFGGDPQDQNDANHYDLSGNGPIAGYHQIIKDISTLSANINNVPTANIKLADKTTLLVLSSTLNLKVSLGAYQAATTQLKTSIVPRMDGCAKGSAPDRNDAVNTCPAQGQVYPVANTLAQECYILSGHEGPHITQPGV